LKREALHCDLLFLEALPEGRVKVLEGQHPKAALPTDLRKGSVFPGASTHTNLSARLEGSAFQPSRELKGRSLRRKAGEAVKKSTIPVILSADSMIFRITTMHENARSALECGGLTPPWNNPGMKATGQAAGDAPRLTRGRRRAEGGVKPPHSKVPSARPFSWGRICSCLFSRR
jgi:hypothetical protein